MKRIIQIILFLFLIFISIIFYKVYFGNAGKLRISGIGNEKQSSEQLSEQSSEQIQNNVIKNLKYEIILDQNTQYIISSDLSEITYEGDLKQVVKMQKVVATIIDKNNISLTITSDKAIYNNATYSTNFIENVRVEYLDHLISSNKMDLNFSSNNISIYENVKYDGLQGIVRADNIKIDLITKKIKIYMNNNKKKVEVITK